MAITVSGVYKTIPRKQNKEILVVAWHFGDAGSVEYFNIKYILPKVISPHNNYWLWGINYLNNYSSGSYIVNFKVQWKIYPEYLKVQNQLLYSQADCYAIRKQYTNIYLQEK